MMTVEQAGEQVMGMVGESTRDTGSNHEDAKRERRPPTAQLVTEGIGGAAEKHQRSAT